MPDFEALSYEYAMEEPEYGTIPKGSPNISRLLQGRLDVWPQPQQARDKRLKHIILADITFRARGASYKNKIIELINNLIKNKAPVFLAT